MSSKKAKTSEKMFISDKRQIERIVTSAMNKISDIVGSTLGPGGKNVLIESDYAGIPNKNTKDGVTVFNSLGAANSYEHLIIEQTRDSAKRTASEAGDGTTTATILSAALVNNLYEFTRENPKYSPQKIVRDLAKVVRTILVPKIRDSAIKIDEDNLKLLKQVARISANGDEDMSEAVIRCFEQLGYAENSHVTIKTASGPSGYEVGMVEGYPLGIGYEESMGKFHNVFVNDQANQRCYLENPKFLLIDGQVNDVAIIENLTQKAYQSLSTGDSEYKNIIVFCHGYSDQVLNILSYNFNNDLTINVIPMLVPRAGFANAQTHILNDLAAFTGATVFGLKDSVADAELTDLGRGMEYFEAYRFRSTVVGDPDTLNIEVRADALTKQKGSAESQEERLWLEERLGKLTSGIAKLTIFGESNGELKEAHDRCEDAVCSVRSAIAKGALPGGSRMLLNLFLLISRSEEIPEHVYHVLAPSLMEPITRLLENAGLTETEIQEVVEKLLADESLVYDVENHQFGDALELGVLDALPAVEEALKNATSIATVMGTLGGLIAYPRDHEFERQEAAADSEFNKILENPHAFVNEANERP